MLARLAREIPAGDYVYEPKWDGFRCLAFKSGPRVDLRSRHQRPMARYFPEVVEALQSLGSGDLVVDGELVVAGADGLDFPALLGRLHPAASRVERLRREAPACFIAFDVLFAGDEDLMPVPFRARRARLERIIQTAAPPLLLTPATGDRSVAQDWLDRFRGQGIDGVIAKALELTYQPGRRAMVKIKRERTAECVVAGFRFQADRPVLGSLLLGLHDAAGALCHVGVASSFTEAKRRELLAELGPLRVCLHGHPWERGFGIGPNPVGRLAGSAGRWDPSEMDLDWTPLRPERVCEVGFDQLDACRFRHPARFLRWRPDREPRSCSLNQLAPLSSPVAEVLSLP